jgi:RNA polymerase sigma-70 factor, ECF subfamily
VNVLATPLVWMAAMMTIGMASGSEGRVLALGDEGSAGGTWLLALTHRELDRAYRLAGFLLGDAHEAEDATQDALARAWDRRSALRSGDSAQAWFDRILVNVCRDRLRRASRVRWVALDDSAAGQSDPFAKAIAADGLLRAVAALDPDHRIVVVLRFWADLPVEAVAARVGVPVGTVKSRLHYAMRDLRRTMGPREADR